MFESMTVPGRRELAFNGLLICDVSDSIDLTDWDERTLRLRLFAIETGGFVASVSLSSSNISIEDVHEAEDLDDKNQVEKFFLSFDPSAHVLHGRRLYSHGASAGMKLQLCDLHHQLVDSVLVALEQHLTVFPVCERVVEPAITNRLLKFFGLVS